MIYNLLDQLSSHINNTDSYKVAHWEQYPKGTEYVSSYIEARGSKYSKLLGDEKYNFAEFFGLQAYIKEYLTKPVDQDDIDLAEEMFLQHGVPFNKKGWQHILDKHNGYLPIEIRALPEGTVGKTSNAMVEIINTDPECFWLTSYVETALLRAVWYPTTVATKSRIIKELLRKELDDTCDNPEAIIDFMLQDFGARGNSSKESSALGGMAHLMNFKGTDTVMGMVATLGYYDPKFDEKLAETPDRPKRALLRRLQEMRLNGEELPGYSVRAAEHSTTTILGPEGEVGQIENLLKIGIENKCIVSIVSDSYDYFDKLINVYGDKLKPLVDELGRVGGKLVIRPDSGNPPDIILKSLQILEEKFGCTENSKTYKVLPSHVRLLQGDGIDLDKDNDNLREILKVVKANKYSAENVCPYGMGGGLEQHVGRDDLEFAQKASAACINGVWHDVFKDPKTGKAKTSKKGLLATIWDGVALVTKPRKNLAPGEVDRLQVVYRNGKQVGETQDWKTIRKISEYFTKLTMNPPKKPVLEPWKQAVVPYPARKVA